MIDTSHWEACYSTTVARRDYVKLFGHFFEMVIHSILQITLLFADLFLLAQEIYLAHFYFRTISNYTWLLVYSGKSRFDSLSLGPVTLTPPWGVVGNVYKKKLSISEDVTDTKKKLA